MAARFATKTITLTGSDKTLSAIVNEPLNEFVSTVSMRAAAGNAGNVSWKDPNGDVGGYIEAREAITFDLSGKFVRLADITISGTVGDIVYLTVIG